MSSGFCCCHPRKKLRNLIKEVYTSLIVLHLFELIHMPKSAFLGMAVDIPDRFLWVNLVLLIALIRTSSYFHYDCGIIDNHDIIEIHSWFVCWCIFWFVPPWKKRRQSLNCFDSLYLTNYRIGGKRISRNATRSFSWIT